ncbi:GNAT family N-acetyltransferase [Gordonia jinhuaensis]|uniref:N-acetyltransferase n=1 Tax=Gordonia jinhuaensis TaxID=1517702 RepID=A0A916SXX8_9ACTN|nr:N-acetyltransferase [Gordonia jinhuaensis]
MVQVVHSPQQERYEAKVNGEYVGYLDYVDEGGSVVITHTVVDQQYGGRGYASKLVRYVLDDLRGKDRTVVPLCSYVADYIGKHPEYSDMVAAPGGR